MQPVNRKHRQTLQVLFSDPVNGNFEGRKVEALPLASSASDSGGFASLNPPYEKTSFMTLLSIFTLKFSLQHESDYRS